MNFKENLKNLRIKNNLTQKELSQILNIPLGNIRNWEQGFSAPKKLETLEELTKILNCDYNELLK
ncbi:MAG: helix-turn-helix transcriptional regulator [Acholeplasmatales bacterium]|nr:helix-turn-helix transcriptional regulator [Acholeplasmatales bacterium]MCI9654210.1 helix-turn-helix transcriptional regulator [Acholeplasmatales bacterium]